MKRGFPIAGSLLVLTVPAMCVSLGLIFLRAPEEKFMGAAQKIFYFHVPSAFVAFLSVFVLLGSSIAYLWTRNRRWDNVSIAATELGMLFAALVLVTGPIWARSAWGVWWTWEAKLTTTLILWMLLAAGLMVRSYAENRDQGARLGAVLGIVAAVDVPIIYKATDWWRGQHPIVFGPAKKDPLHPHMLQAFLFSLVVFLLLYGLLLAIRVRLAEQEDRVQVLHETVSSR